MLEKVTVIDKIEALESGHLQVRRATYIVEDGTRVGLLGYHRVAYNPLDDLSAEDEQVQAHAKIARTPEKVQAFTDIKAAQLAEIEVKAG